MREPLYSAVVALAGALCVLLPLIGVTIYRPNRWQRTIWRFKFTSNKKPKIIIERVAGEETTKYTRPTAGLGAVVAVAQLTTALNLSRSGLFRRMTRSIEQPIELCFSSEERADNWCSTADTVVVGGPMSNTIAAEALRAYGCQPLGIDPVDEVELKRRTGDLRVSAVSASGLGVATQGNAIYWFGDKREGSVKGGNSSEEGTSGYGGYDYGVILRLPSPTNAAYRTVVVFGSQTFGVNAASSWLVNVRSRAAGREVRSIMAKNRNIAVLVKADVNHGALSDPEVVEIIALPDLLSPRHW